MTQTERPGRTAAKQVVEGGLGARGSLPSRRTGCGRGVFGAAAACEHLGSPSSAARIRLGDEGRWYRTARGGGRGKVSGKGDVEEERAAASDVDAVRAHLPL